MKIHEFFIKALSLIIITALAVCAYGREIALSAFAENNSLKKRILVNDENGKNSAIADVENTAIARRKNAVISGGGGELPFLCKCINYKCRESGEYLCFYNTNQEMIYSISGDMCVYFRYDCPVGRARLSANECLRRARKGVYTAFSRVGVPAITSVRRGGADEKICTFFVKTDITGDAEIKISIRRDTGSVILFDFMNEEALRRLQKLHFA